MQKFGKTLITNVGRQMLTEVDGAKGKITYTKAKLYTEQIGKMSEEQIVALTNLDGLQLETSLDVTNVEDTTVTVSASFNNAKVTKDLAFNSIGWFARTSVDDTEKLLAITPSEIEQTIVASDNGASTTSLDIEMVFARSHDTTVVVKPIEAGLVSSSQLKEAITDLKIKLEAEFPSLKEQVKQEVNDQINALSALNNSSGGNNLYNQKIDLDVYSTIGITKFLGCQLQSTGSMYGFDPSTTNLYGWIFNVPKWNGATQYDQIVYICDYGKGTLIYIRTKVDNTGSNQEDFEKLTTDKDLTFFTEKLRDMGQVKTVDGIKPDSSGNVQTDHFTREEHDASIQNLRIEILNDFKNLYSTTENGAKLVFSQKKLALNDITDTGIYRISNCQLVLKENDNVYKEKFSGWIINLNYENSATSETIYQFVIGNENISYRIVSIKNNNYPIFNEFVYKNELINLKAIIDNIKEDCSKNNSKLENEIKTEIDALKTKPLCNYSFGYEKPKINLSNLKNRNLDAIYLSNDFEDEDYNLPVLFKFFNLQNSNVEIKVCIRRAQYHIKDDMMYGVLQKLSSCGFSFTRFIPDGRKLSDSDSYVYYSWKFVSAQQAAKEKLIIPNDEYIDKLTGSYNDAINVNSPIPEGTYYLDKSNKYHNIPDLSYDTAILKIHCTSKASFQIFIPTYSPICYRFLYFSSNSWSPWFKITGGTAATLA